jgi:hypothetical protein
VPLALALSRLLQAAIETGGGDLDNAAIIRQLRRELFGQPPIGGIAVGDLQVFDKSPILRKVKASMGATGVGHGD